MAEPTLVAYGPEMARAGLLHRVLVPDAPGPHPTVVMLHGRAGSEEDMWVFRPSVPEGWLLVAPRGLHADDAGFAWHPPLPELWPSLGAFDEAVLALRRFLLALPEIYGADPERVYLMGFSQGAALSYALAMAYRQLVQGIAGLVGFVPTRTENAVETAALQDLPIFMAVGKRDRFIPFERAKRCAETLREAGADLTYRVYDVGHRLPADGVRDLRAWWDEVKAREGGA
jgi:phospholipase/carboxylesterase